MTDLLTAAKELLPNAPEWLLRAREAHANMYATNTINKENWKYCNYQAIRENYKEIAQPTTVTLKQQQVNFASGAKHLLTFVDGYFCAELSTTKELATQIELGNLRTISTKINTISHSHFDTLIPTYLQPFASLNFAAFADGYVLRIPANIKITEPIHIVFLATEQLQNKNCNLHNLIIAEPNSQITVIEKYLGLGNAAYFNNIFTTITTQENAAVTHIKLQQESSAATHLHNWQIIQHKNSTLKTQYANTGAKFSRDALAVTLKNQQASYNARGIYLLKNSQTADYHTRIEHLAPNTTSNVLFKGILNDKATGIFNGRIYVDKNAPKTEAHLTNKNLVLSPTATMYTTPELEIYAEDVICTHGATVGQLDEAALFYLLTRGIAEPEAKQLLIQGFIQDILNDFPEKLPI